MVSETLHFADASYQPERIAVTHFLRCFGSISYGHVQCFQASMSDESQMAPHQTARCYMKNEMK